jgi:hypothetical protein
MSAGTGINRVSSFGLGYHVFWITSAALLLSYEAAHFVLRKAVLDVLIHGGLTVLWTAILAQTIAIVAQGRYKKPVPPVELTKKATAEDVR